MRRNPSLIADAVATLKAQGIAVDLLPTQGPGDATALARRCVEQGAGLVVALGGDGTINEVVNGLALSHTPLAILPGGTANCLAVELGIGTNPLRAASKAGQWKQRRIALGLAEAGNRPARYFAVMAGAGVDAQIVRDVNPGLKKKLGKVAYWVAGLSAVFRRLPEMNVTIGGKTSRVSFALASRVRNYGGDLEIAKTIRITDPRFETVLFEGEFAFRYLKYLTGVLVNLHRGMSGVRVELTEALALHPANGEPIFLQLDGEDYAQLPAQLRIIPEALTLMAPDWRA